MAIKFEGSQEAADADSNFPVAPEGTIVYMKVDKATEGMSKGNPEKGTPPRPMLTLELVVSHGEWADRIRVWYYLTFIEAGAKGHGMTLHALHAFGFDPEGENDYSAESFKDRGVKAELGEKVWKGKKGNEIKALLIDENAADQATDAAGDAANGEAGDTSFNPEELERPAPTPAKAAPPASRGATATASRPSAPAAPTRKLPWKKK